MAVVVAALKVVGGKAVGHLAVAVVKETAVDGLVEQATHPAEGAAMHLPAVAKEGWALNWTKGFFNKKGRKKQYMRITLVSLTATVASCQILTNMEILCHITINARNAIALCF